MKNRMLFAFALVGAMVTPAAQALAAAGGDKDHAANYAPQEKLISGTLPVNDSYTLAITSPSDLNSTGLEALTNGITVTLTVSAHYPEAASEAIALSLITLSENALTYTALSQTQNVSIAVHAPAGTPAGTYTYDIKADPPAKFGWGGGTATLNLDLSDPVVTADTTPPSVLITSPARGTAFDFCSAGNNVSIAIDASDAESLVTEVNASVNGTAVELSNFTPANNVSVSGTYLATDIGSYEISASAKSAGGTSAPVTSSFAVNYTMAFLPPLSLGKTSKGGSTIPIKFSARDCTGAFVADQRVTVKVYEGATLVFTAVYGDSSADVRIDEIAQQYITNFQTALGAHTYTANILFGTIQQASITFSTR